MCADKGAAEEEEWEDEDGDGEKDNQAISGLAEFRGKVVSLLYLDETQKMQIGI